jgi:Cytochrome P450
LPKESVKALIASLTGLIASTMALASYLAKSGISHPALTAALKFAEANPVAASILGLGVLVFSVALAYDYCKRFPLRRIPGPVGLPLFGHVLYMVGTPWLTLHRFAQKYGGIYLIRFWTRPFVVLSDPDHVKRVFKDEKKKYVKDQWSYDYFR